MSLFCVAIKISQSLVKYKYYIRIKFILQNCRMKHRLPFFFCKKRYRLRKTQGTRDGVTNPYQPAQQ